MDTVTIKGHQINLHYVGYGRVTEFSGGDVVGTDCPDDSGGWATSAIR